MFNDKSQNETLLIIFALLIIIVIIANIYTGLTVQKIGIPGFFEIEFGAPNPTPTPPQKTGSISVSSSPSGASIYLDESYQGSTPMTIKNVEAGSHTITLKYTDYQDWSETIGVLAGEIAYVSPSLISKITPTPTTGSISVSSFPSGASIYLDESYQGSTPMTIKNVEAGSHTITLKYTDYQDWSETIGVLAGKIAYVSRSLEQNIKRFDEPTIKGYRLDWCRLDAEDCGRGAADAFCRSMGYSYAVLFEIDPNIGASSPTYVINTGTICNKDYCDGFKYITCK